MQHLQISSTPGGIGMARAKMRDVSLAPEPISLQHSAGAPFAAKFVDWADDQAAESSFGDL